MIESLFRYPRVLARHLAGPSVEARDRFLAHCAHAGAARESLLRLARELLLVARRIDISGTRAIAPQEVETAADGWVRYQRRRHRISPHYSEGWIEKSLRFGRNGLRDTFHAQTERLSHARLYHTECSVLSPALEAADREVRPRAQQCRRRRTAAQGGGRATRPLAAAGVVPGGSAAAGQGAPRHARSVAAADVRDRLWLPRRQRRGATGRRPHPQAPTRAGSDRGRAFGLAAHALALREHGAPGGSLSPGERAGGDGDRASPPEAAREGPAHHDRSGSDG